MLVTPGLQTWDHTGETGNPVRMQRYRSIDHLTTVVGSATETETVR